MCLVAAIDWDAVGAIAGILALVVALIGMVAEPASVRQVSRRWLGRLGSLGRDWGGGALVAAACIYLLAVEAQERDEARALRQRGRSAQGEVVLVVDFVWYRVEFDDGAGTTTRDLISGWNSRTNKGDRVTVWFDPEDSSQAAVGGDTAYAFGPRKVVTYTVYWSALVTGLLIGGLGVLLFGALVLGAILRLLWVRVKRSGATGRRSSKHGDRVTPF